ncbi:hypothetical protein BV234_09890, partial [Lactiplantibacillus plantarum]
VPTTFRQLAEMPGGRRRTNELSRFTLTRTVSSGSKLAAFEFKKWHVLIIITASNPELILLFCKT